MNTTTSTKETAENTAAEVTAAERIKYPLGIYKELGCAAKCLSRKSWIISAENIRNLSPLYNEIYSAGSRKYWENLDSELKNYATESGLRYLRDDDSMKFPFDAPPVMVNFFYHEEIKKSAKKPAEIVSGKLF